MRVGQFTDTFLPVVDGVGRVVSQYAEGIGSRGHDCHVITPRQDNPQPVSPAYRLVCYRGVALPRLRQYRVGLPTLSPRYRRTVAQISFDIVHAHDPFMAGREALRVARRQEIPLVATFHSKYYDDIDQITHSSSIARLLTKNIVRFYSRCDEVWAVSRSTADVLHSYGYAGDIRIMENGTDVKAADPSAVDKVNSIYGLTAEPVLLYVGQLNWKKNIRRIIEALHSLSPLRPDVRLLIAGQGPSEHEIRQLVRTDGLDEQVIFTGHISDPELLLGLYARAQLLVFPSLYDNAPMVVREAASVGTPSLLAAGSSAAEVVQDGVNGLLAADTTQAVADRIAWALDNRDQLRQIGESARQTIPRAWSDVISEVLERYEDLIRPD